MRKNIVKGIAVSLVLGYVSTMLVLYFTKVIRLDFSNIIDIAKVVAPFVVLLVGATLLLSCKLGKSAEENVRKSGEIAPELLELSSEIDSDLESIVREQSEDHAGCRGLDVQLSKDFAETREGLKKEGPVFLFQGFNNNFDLLLGQALVSQSLIISEDRKIKLDVDKLLRQLGTKKVLEVVLSARLMMRNPMLSILYPDYMVSCIEDLSKISIENSSLDDCRLASGNISKCLNAKVYGFDSYGKLVDGVLNSVNAIVASQKDMLSTGDGDTLCKMRVSERENALRELLLVPRLGFYFVQDEVVRAAVENTHFVLDSYCQVNSQDGTVDLSKMIDGLVDKLRSGAVSDDYPTIINVSDSCSEVSGVLHAAKQSPKPAAGVLHGVTSQTSGKSSLQTA